MGNQDFRKVAAKMGTEIGRLEKAPLSNFAMASCREAAEGHVLPEQAAELFEEFQRARHLAKEGKRLGQAPGPVQVSKYRQFLKVGNELGLEGFHMLERLMKQDFFDRLKCGAYEALLSVARRALKEGRVLSDTEIKSLLNEA